jgi:hypothetical protein
VDHRQFDNLARSLATLTATSSRRAFARKLAAFSLAAAFGSRIRLEEAEAKSCQAKCNKKKTKKQKAQCKKKCNENPIGPEPNLIKDPPPPPPPPPETESCVAGTICRNASCTGSVARSETRCDSSGSCPLSTEQSCGLFQCNADGTACRGTCGNDDHCVNGYWCNGGECQPKQPKGTACSAATPNQCRSGFCVDRVCCDSACVAPENTIRSCSTGTCDFACIEGFANCDNDLSNGCESDLSSNATCGNCGTRCPIGRCGPSRNPGFWTCLNGECVCEIPEL